MSEMCRRQTPLSVLSVYSNVVSCAGRIIKVREKSRPTIDVRSTMKTEKYVAPVAFLISQATETAVEALPPTPAAAVNPFSGESVVPCSDGKIVRNARAQRVNRVLAQPPPRQVLSSAHPVGQQTTQVHVGETGPMCLTCRLVKS